MFGFMVTTSNDTCLKSQHQISKMMGVRHLGFVGQYVIIWSKLPHNLNPRGQIIQKSTFIHKCGPLSSKFEFRRWRLAAILDLWVKMTSYD